MKISVVLPLNKPEKQLKKAIESVLAQDFNDLIELIIVNDYSTDAHQRILSSYQNDTRVRILQTDSRKGLSASLNLGLKQASGKYVSRMDAGVVMSPTMLRKTFEEHERFGQEVAFVGSKRYWISYSGKSYCKISEIEDLYKMEYLDDLIQRQQIFTDAGTLFNRCQALAVGGYNDYAGNGADLDLWLRIMEYTGKPCLTLNELLIGKRLMPGSIIFNPGMNLDTSIVRELSRHRQYSGLPAIHQPSPELLAEMKMKMSDHILIKKRVHMPVDIAMINLWLKDYQGFAAFLKMSVSRNPVQTSKILVRHLIFGWYHDFIEGEYVASIR